jgi:signal transduction histidine kinase
MIREETMENKPVRVLLIGDEEADYVLTGELLAAVPGPSFQLEWRRNYEAGLAALLAQQHDVCLVDHHLNRHSGLELLRAARAAGCEGPIILLTGQDDREVDLEAMRAGAADCLCKTRLEPATLERAIRYARERHRAALELRRAREELELRVAERTAELSRANALLVEADRRKNEFLAMLAHELRNPLAPIRNGLEILRLAGNNAQVREEARSLVERQVNHLSRLVEDLLDVSRITHGKMRLQRQRLDLARLARTTAEDRRPTLEQAGLRLTLELPEVPVWVMGDETRLAQVLNNLLDNAAKFTDRGGEVMVRLRREPGPQAVLSVRDTGVGWQPALLERLFEPFAQEDRTLGRAGGGLGLGLALVKGLIELHGGRVNAVSEGPGKGAEFLVRLPAAPEPAALSQMPAGSRPTGEQLRILVVEDHCDAAETLRLLLELLGHQVKVAHSGPEGVRAAGQWRPDVVLCDIGLPGLDGYGVARALRQDQATAKARLVAVTGYGQEEDRRRAFEAGFDHHLTKPVGPEELETLLRRR